MIKQIVTYILFLIFAFFSCWYLIYHKQKPIGSFTDAVQKADIVMIVTCFDDFHYLIDKLGSTRVDSTENILKKGDNYLHENIFFLRKSVYPEDKEWKKRYLEYQTNKLNNDPDYVLRDQRYLMCCEVLYTKQELNTYKIQYFENALWSERKIKTLIPGDTLIVALKKMTETNELKHRLMTLIEVPNSMTYVPFEDCTSYVQIHGDTCYGQITEPYSLGEPEKYPYIYEEMPVEEIFRLIKSIHPISEKVTITDD